MPFCKPYPMIAAAALAGAALPWAASAQDERRTVDAGGQAAARSLPAPVVRSDLWVLIDAQRRQPAPATLPPAGQRRLTPEQRLQLREQVRSAYQPYLPEARRPAPLPRLPEGGN